MRKPKFKTFSEVLQEQLNEVSREELERIVFKAIQRTVKQWASIKQKK